MLLKAIALLAVLCADSVFANVLPHDGPLATPPSPQSTAVANQYRVLILGGGVSGIIAAETLFNASIKDFLVVEARGEIGGRMMSATFGSQNKTIELGANWIQGTTNNITNNTNPIYTLAQISNLTTIITEPDSLTTYDYNGPINYTQLVVEAADNYTNLTINAGGRVPLELVDITARAQYSVNGSKPFDHMRRAAEYYNFDYEYAQTPEQTSAIASSWANNFTFDAEAGGFSSENRLSTDQRGFSTIIKRVAARFQDKIKLNYEVTSINDSSNGVTVFLKNGSNITADYVLCTFSLGVLQHDDVVFVPSLPNWKKEALNSMTMGTYTKIFLQFPRKFWFDTIFGLYADRERGRYPAWQNLDKVGFFEGSNMTFVTVTGDYSLRVESLPESVVKEEIVSVLEFMFKGVNIPQPTSILYHNWTADPLYRGSYSNWPASLVTGHHQNIRANVSERFWFAGEHGSQKWFGFLHGAYADGKDVATEMIKCINKTEGCTGIKHFEKVENKFPYWLNGT